MELTLEAASLDAGKQYGCRLLGHGAIDEPLGGGDGFGGCQDALHLQRCELSTRLVLQGQASPSDHSQQVPH